MADQQTLILKKLDELKETLGEHGERLERVEDKQDAVSVDVEQLLMDVKGIRDDIGLATFAPHAGYLRTLRRSGI